MGSAMMRRGLAPLLIIASIAAGCTSGTAPNVGSPSPQTVPPGLPAHYDYAPNVVPVSKFTAIERETSICGDRLPESPTPHLVVYMACDEEPLTDEGEGAYRLTRTKDGEGDPLSAALRFLFAGPSSEESSAGFSSDLGSGDPIVFTATVIDTLAVIDGNAALHRALLGVAPFAQLVLTAAANTGVEHVSVLIDGTPHCVVETTCEPPTG